jgi:pheromone shutdown protein TraB
MPVIPMLELHPDRPADRMSVPETDTTLPAPLALRDQPVERVIRGGVEYVVLGTAHVSRSSMEAVEAMLAHESFDAVAVELCDSRAQGMRDPESFKQMDLFKVIRQGKAGMVAASLVLSTFQKRLADQSGIQPGAEMKAAMDGAEQRQLPLWLIDREVGTTLKRAWRSVGFWQRFGLLGGLLASVFEREQIEQVEIEKLKQGDLLESAFSEFASESKPLYDSLIGERDAFMAARLRQESARSSASETPARRVLVVIGAGHLKGLCEQLRTQQDDPSAKVTELAATPPKARWPKWLAAGAHPLSIVAAFIAAPIKPFRPGIPAGGISAMAEAWVRRPRVIDFDTLRDDIVHWSGWWKNRVARTLLNFFLVSVGTIVGEYSAGIHIFKSLV